MSSIKGIADLLYAIYKKAKSQIGYINPNETYFVEMKGYELHGLYSKSQWVYKLVKELDEMGEPV